MYIHVHLFQLHVDRTEDHIQNTISDRTANTLETAKVEAKIKHD